MRGSTLALAILVAVLWPCAGAALGWLWNAFHNRGSKR